MQSDNRDLEAVLAWVRSHYFGKYAGQVIDTNDELKKGRLKVEVPDVFGAGAAAAVWAMPCVPYAGAQVGFKFLPPDKANVWIEFEKGDPGYPVWTGFFWADGEMPAEAGEADNIKLLKTGSFTLTIDDEAGELVITATDGASLTINSDLKAEAGGASVVVATDGVTVDGGGKTVEATQISVKINGGAFEVT